jgi:hypothetical protein
VILPFENDEDWEGRWSLEEFSGRVVDAIVPRLPDEEFVPVSIDKLAEKPSAGDK